MTRSLVWLKRDLRLHDHAPLAMAMQGPAAALWIVEPEWLQSPEFAQRHLDFATRSVEELRLRLARRGLPLMVRHGSAVAVLQDLWTRHRFERLLSHEETGPGWSYDRDRAVAAWCRERGVRWEEIPQHGVVRRLGDRKGWARRWAARMDAPMVDMPGALRGGETSGKSPVAAAIEAAGDPAGAIGGEAGERAGLRRLAQFLQGGGRGYRRALSSPLTAEEGCSRLSAHLAFGTLSLRRVHQATEAAIVEAQQQGDRSLAHGLRGFSGRLRWHCHFMQKLEDEPAIEFRAFARSCDGLRPGDDAPGAPAWGTTQASRLQAWQEGRTGYPMVDACMRSLNATGWLNFRMRAMLVSFASYHLWLHWRPTGLHLARQFTDFEAGIHWSQMQMQSGTTGINTLRIYSPTKQALDQDPQGEFIRRWVPELQQVPLHRLATPWRMDAAEQSAAGCRIGLDYPEPIVEEKAAAQAAKDAMYGLRREAQARSEADRIQERHGSRKSGLPQTGLGRRGSPPRAKAAAKPAPDNQLDLFDA